MTHDTKQRDCVHIQYRGKPFDIPVGSSCTLHQLAKCVAAATGAAHDTLKLLTGGRTCLPWKAPQQLVRDAGLLTGKWLLLASSKAEVEGVRSSRDLPGLPSFEHEEAREALRSRPSQSMKLPSGPHTFQSFRAWEPPEGVQPAVAHALALLHRLAADPGIVAIMKGHHWSVGLLAEMPPEGFVGISPVCILGYNTNKGQEIHLRLRTDDLKGFRRYQPIRDTLIHELAHNVHSAHDNLFKTLNSQLQKECLQHSGPGRTLAASDYVSSAAKTIAPSQLSSPEAHKLGGASASAQQMDTATAAAAAALVRSQLNPEAIRSSLHNKPVVSGTADRGSSARFPQPADKSAHLSQPADDNADVPLHADDSATLPQPAANSVEGLGHWDTASERDEKAMAALEALPQPQPTGPASTAVLGHCNAAAEKDEAATVALEALLQRQAIDSASTALLVSPASQPLEPLAPEEHQTSAPGAMSFRPQPSGSVSTPEGLGIRVAERHTLSPENPLAQASLDAPAHNADCPPSLRLPRPADIPPSRLPASQPGSKLPAALGVEQSEAPPLSSPRQRPPHPTEPVSNPPATKASTDDEDCQAKSSSTSQQQICSSDTASQLPTDMEISHSESMQTSHPESMQISHPESMEIGHPESQPSASSAPEPLAALSQLPVDMHDSEVTS